MKGTDGDPIDFFWNTAAKGSIPPPATMGLIAFFGVGGLFIRRLLL
jgi:hypothetical protein